jgi:non-ribosomal peptide synthetase component E (peptide arylation enzyme)
MSTTRACVPVEGVFYRPSPEVDRYFEKGAWLRSTVGDAVRVAAQETPDKIYLIAGEEKISFAELDRRTEILGTALLDIGLKPGDRAMFQMGSVAETVIALVACYKAGILPVCTLPQYRDIEISQLSDMSGATGYFVQADNNPNFELVAFAQKMMQRSLTLKHLIVSRGVKPAGAHSLEDLIATGDYIRARERLSAIKLSPEDVLTFQLSGGSTGVPKIIPRFHGEYLGQAEAWAQLHRFTGDDTAIWPLPVIHNAAMLLVVLPGILKQATIILQDRFDLQMFLGAIQKHRVTYAGSIGPVAPRLLDFPDVRKHFDLSSLRLFVGMDRADAIEAHIGITAMNLYGITEGLLMTTPPEEAQLQRHTTNGYPSHALDNVRVLDPESETQMPPGKEGELCFFGPHSVRAYYNAPDEINRTSFTSDGYFRTGDIVSEHIIDGRSYYKFLGRLKDNISRGNEKFAAEEVERLIVMHPYVLDAKVVAMPDRYLGERACAFIIPRPGANAPDVPTLGQFLVTQGLAKFKLPERIETIAEFPVTRVGKVDKMAMRKIAAEKLANENSAEKAAG